MPTVESDVQIEFEVFCADCGAGLCGSTTVKRGTIVEVSPCSDCMKKAQEVSYSSGYDAGYNDAVNIEAKAGL